MKFSTWLLMGLLSAAAWGCGEASDPNVYNGDGGLEAAFSGAFRSSDGLVIELVDDQAVVTAVGAYSAGLKPGDVYLDNVVRTGDETWEGDARVVNPQSGAAAYVPVTITIDYSLQITASPGSPYIGKAWQSVPASMADAGIKLDGGSMVDSGVTKPLMVTTILQGTALTNALFEVRASGGLPYTQIGVVVSTQPNPTTASTLKATSTRTFEGTHTMSLALEQCLKYYARAYVIEMGGNVTYGNQVEFKNSAPNPDWCSPLNGTWGTSDGKGPTLQGSPQSFKFVAIPDSTSTTGWDAARDKGLIGIGSEYITMIMPSGKGWTCQVLWLSGTSSQGVTAVKYHPGTISISSDEKSITINSTNSDTGSSGSVTFVRR